MKDNPAPQSINPQGIAVIVRLRAKETECHTGEEPIMEMVQDLHAHLLMVKISGWEVTIEGVEPIV